MTRRIRAANIIHVVGIIVAAVGAAMGAAGVVANVYGSPDAVALYVSAGIAVIGGLMANRLTKVSDELSIRESYIIVTFAWLWSALFGALPYWLSGSTTSLLDAFFESMSGFTTTGASIFPDPESLTLGILFWRSMSQWLGGMGIIVLVVAVLPFLGVGGMQLFRAEVPGPTPDRLRPRISQTAKILWGVYVGLTAVQAVLLLIGGMSVFDAITHAFATLPTGGFSPRSASIGAYASPYFEYVTIVFMYLAGVNFALHYRVLTGRTRSLLADEEWRFYTGLLLTAAAVVFAALLIDGTYHGLERSFRAALFQVVSIGTTTGYATADYVAWPWITQAVLLMLMFIGGMAGSTGGGMKTLRVWAAHKTGMAELKKHLHPRGIMLTHVGGKVVSEGVILNIVAFMLLFIGGFVLGSMMLTALGIDLLTSMGATAAAIGNIGPGLAAVGPSEHYAWMPDSAKLILSALMLLGRLEIYTVIVLFQPEFWRR